MEQGQPGQPELPTGIRLTEEQLRRRRARSVAIGLALGALVILFWAASIVKMSGNLGHGG